MFWRVSLVAIIAIGLLIRQRRTVLAPVDPIALIAVLDLDLFSAACNGSLPTSFISV